jgi:hypothetical protein
LQLGSQGRILLLKPLHNVMLGLWVHICGLGFHRVAFQVVLVVVPEKENVLLSMLYCRFASIERRCCEQGVGADALEADQAWTVNCLSREGATSRTWDVPLALATS